MSPQRRVEVPEERLFDPTMGAWLCTGTYAHDEVPWLPAGITIATDIETPGLDNAFTINCVTVSWLRPDSAVTSILLDPSRRPQDAETLRTIYDRAGSIILHNACFDIPPLYHAGLMDRTHIAKVVDTLLLARFTYPDPFVRTGHTVKRMSMSLSGLVVDHLGWPDHKGGLELAFKAAGFRTQQAGYEGMDIDSATYRRGAMADTTATLLLEPILRRAAINWTLDHPFEHTGATTTEDATAVLATQEQVHRVMLRRNAVGIAVDHDYLAKYQEQVDGDRRLHELTLAQVGLEGGKGKEKDIVAYLDTAGELPANWPRTPTGRLRATKADLDAIDHPIARAQRGLSATDQILGYLAKVERQAAVTGRCHPQAATLGASQTGRTAYSEPPLQQFSGDARGILVSDNPDADSHVQWLTDVDSGTRRPTCTGPGQQLWSIDWSTIEPVTLAAMAHDVDFITPFEAGADIYEPVSRACGVPRKVAKVVLLQTLYGSGVPKLAATIGHTEESAAQIRRQMFAAMPGCARFMSKVEAIGEQFGKIVTVGGRILPVDPEGVYKAVNYCVAPHTPILTADLRHVPSDSIKVGDELVGFDEHRSAANGRGTGKRFFRPAVVEAVSTVSKPSVIVRAGERATTCSADHLWLVRCLDKNHRMQWVRADELVPGYHQMLSLGVWDIDPSREAGYLAGLLDGEGSMTSRAAGHKTTSLVFSQKPGAVMDTFCTLMNKVNLTYGYSPNTPGSTSPTDNVRITGLSRIMRTIGTLRPERFVARSRELFDGAEMHTLRQMEAVPVVESVTPCGDIELVSIQTSTRTLVANGYLSHNCIQGSAYDLLANAVCEVEKAGLGDAIAITMHDEIVIDGDEATAAEVERIMQTPPDFLTRWAGRTPVLRTDRQPTGRAWASV